MTNCGRLITTLLLLQLATPARSAHLQHRLDRLLADVAGGQDTNTEGGLTKTVSVGRDEEAQEMDDIEEKRPDEASMLFFSRGNGTAFFHPSMRRHGEPPPDPFQSEAFLSAQTTKEKCKVLNQALWELNNQGYYTYHHGYDESGENDFSEKCATADENARGTYVARNKACAFVFHQIAMEEDFSDHSFSTACSKSNMIPKTSYKEYIKPSDIWQDECVGDHLRCYTIGRDDHIFLKHFCDEEKKRIPEGTTHISVDCTEDKTFAKSKRTEGESWWRRDDKRQAESHKFILILLAVVTLLGFLCILLIHRCFWAPYLQVIMSHKTGKKHDADETRAFLNHSSKESSPETGHNDNTMVRRKKGNETDSILSRV